MANSSIVTACSIGGTVLFVQSANVTLSRTTLPTTALGDSWETNVHGVARISGSVEVLYDKSDHSAMVDQCETAGSALAAIEDYQPVPLPAKWMTASDAI